MSKINWDEWVGTNFTRWHMTKPFPYKNKALATNDHHIIAAKFDGEFDEDFLTQNKRFHDKISELFTEWLVPEVSEWIDLHPMEFVHLYKRCTECGRGHTSNYACHWCEDDVLEEFQSIAVGNYILDKEYFCKIANLPNAKIAAKKDDSSRIKFMADEIVGFVMPLRRKLKIHEIFGASNEQ